MTEETKEELIFQIEDQLKETWKYLRAMGYCCEDIDPYEVDDLSMEELQKLFKNLRRMQISLELISEKYIPDEVWSLKGWL